MLIVINALMLLLTSTIAERSTSASTSTASGPRCWGSIVISIASMVLERDLPAPAAPVTASPLPAPTGTPYRIAFVCLGNICRSPMADVVLTQLVDDAGLADEGRGLQLRHRRPGTSASRWTRGPPHSCWRRGTTPRRTGRRSSTPSWLEQDLVLAMDAKNLADITDGRRASDRVRMFRSFDPLVPSQGPPTSTSPTRSTAATRASST